MSVLIPKTFKVEREAWENFIKAADSYGMTPAMLLRELIAHVDAAVKGVQSGRIQNLDGDMAALIRTEFPQLSPLQLQSMADVLIQAAKMNIEKKTQEQPTPRNKNRSKQKYT